MTLSEGDAVTQAATTRQDTPEDAKRAPYGLDDLMGLEATTGAVSPAMARHMRDSMHFERQRPISEGNVKRLAGEMAAGWFLPGTPIFICVLPDGRQQIVNGNHTLEAVAASGVTIPLTMIRKRVRNMEDVARCYATFDIQKMRTWRDTLQASGMGETIPLADKVMAALGVIMAGFTYSKADYLANQSRHARLQVLPDYQRAAHVIGEAVQGAPKMGARMIQRASFLAVALYTAKYQPSMATEFWGGFAKDDGLRSTDPRKMLFRWGASNPSGQSNKRPIECIAAALAWNAFFQGKDVGQLKPGAVSSIRILGTPLHKGAAE